MSDLAFAPARPAPPVRTPGRPLPRASYVDPDEFSADLETVFYPGWLFAGHSCEVGEPGQYLTFSLGTESVIVARDDAGVLHAHHNVCRHRGSRILTADRGTARALVCPYHQWVYDLDGQLRSARLMGDCFSVDRYRLIPAAVREVAGLVFVCFAPNPPPFESAAGALEPQLRPHGLDRAKVIARHSYTVRANWKTLIENNRECYHCRGNHPEFLQSNFDLGSHGEVRANAGYEQTLAAAYERWETLGLAPQEVSFPDGAWFRVSRLPLKKGFATESADGRAVAPTMGTLPDADTGSLRIIGLPNLWAHANRDYAMTTRVTPQSAGVTVVDVTFLVDRDAVEGVDYDPERVTAVWRATSEQDWELCENNYAGIQSRAYFPGPLSTVTENSVEAFLAWYADRRSGSFAGAT
jgi:Rieske 2Fe-2S family protein